MNSLEALIAISVLASLVAGVLVYQKQFITEITSVEITCIENEFFHTNGFNAILETKSNCFNSSVSETIEAFAR
ncbi:MAG: hypothetical protein ABH803_02180 [Candidatus Micrarchaeota archaeon]